MTVIELRDKLNRLMKEFPNTMHDDVYFVLDYEIGCVDKLSIEYDIEDIGRYVVLR